MKIGDQIVVDDRVFILRGVDLMSMAARRVYREDAETGKLVTELLASARTLVESEPDQSDGEPNDRLGLRAVRAHSHKDTPPSGSRVVSSQLAPAGRPRR